MKKSIILLLCIFFSIPANAQTVQANIPGVNNAITAIVRNGNVVYITGDFDTVGTTPRKYLAAIDANTGSVLPWNPDPNQKIRKIIIAGNKLVVIGNFDSISNVARNGICFFDLPSNNILNSTSGGWYSSPYGLHYSGNYVYYCDYDSAFNFAVRRIDINTLQQDTTWSSTKFSLPSASSLTTLGNYIYAGGDFAINNFPTLIQDICRFDINTGILDTTFKFSISNSDWIEEVLGYNNKIYVTGSFQTLGGVYKNGIAEIDPAGSGSITSKSFNCSSSQNCALFAQGSYLWIGGNSASLGGMFRMRVAQININTGIASCWDVSGLGSGNASYISVICVQGDTVYTGHPYFSNFFNPFKAFVGNPSYINIGNDTILCPGNTISISASSSFQSYLWSTGATTSAITISNPGTYCIEASSSNGCKALDCIEVQACTAIENNQNDIQFHAVPNISTGKYQLHFPTQTASGILEIIDFSGKLMRMISIPASSNTLTLDISNFSKGIYFCRAVLNDQKSSVVKLIKE